MSTPDKRQIELFEQIQIEFWMHAYLVFASKETYACAEYYAIKADEAVCQFAERFDPRNKHQQKQPKTQRYLDGQKQLEFCAGCHESQSDNVDIKES